MTVRSAAVGSRLGYANRAYRDLFGTRTPGRPAAEALPELTALGVLPLLDQVLRSGRPRSVKSRCILGLGGNRYYNIACVPLGPDEHTTPTASLIFATEVTDQVQAAGRLRDAERRQREAAVTLQQPAPAETRTARRPPRRRHLPARRSRRRRGRRLVRRHRPRRRTHRPRHR
ncbi:PAS domain-containing protein [Kitasatospora griseola]